MEPRDLTRGNEGHCQVVNSTVHASMEPRDLTRGNFVDGGAALGDLVKLQWSHAISRVETAPYSNPITTSFASPNASSRRRETSLPKLLPSFPG